MHYRYIIEDCDEDEVTEIPLPNVKAAVLKKVIEFCQHHRSEPMTEIEKPLKSAQMAEVVQKWYADFVAVEQVILFELILAAAIVLNRAMEWQIGRLPSQYLWGYHRFKQPRRLEAGA